MPDLNRRSFLQIAGAAGVSPLFPGMVGSGAGVAKSSVSTSKALWASLYSNSGSVTEFVGFAKNMGLSNTAIQSVSARSLGIRVALAASTEKLAGTGVKNLRAPLPSHDTDLRVREKLKRGLEEVFADETDVFADRKTVDLSSKSLIEDSDAEILPSETETPETP